MDLKKYPKESKIMYPTCEGNESNRVRITIIDIYRFIKQKFPDLIASIQVKEDIFIYQFFAINSKRISIYKS